MVGIPSVQKMSLTATGSAAQALAIRSAGARLGAPQVGVRARRRRPPRRRRRSTRPTPSSPASIRPIASAAVSSSSSAHAWGDGTRKAPSAGSGAGSSARSRGRLGSGSSARQTFSSATTWEVGSTPSRSSAEIRSTCSRMPESSRGHPLDLLLGELEPREPGDVENLVAIDHERLRSRTDRMPRADDGGSRRAFRRLQPAAARRQLRARRAALHRHPRRDARRARRLRRLAAARRLLPGARDGASSSGSRSASPT